MEQRIVDIPGIKDLHRLCDVEPPKHPLVSVLNLEEIHRINIPEEETGYRFGFYSVYFKQLPGHIGYGRSRYDFDQGTMIFISPGQVLTSQRDQLYDEGWGLFFHPDLLYRSVLHSKMAGYSFFQYSSNEALHLSEAEKQILHNCISNIQVEYSQSIDRHSQALIVSNIELLLNYCTRFYDRQFFTRVKVNHDLVQQFEELLLNYFSQESLIHVGLPDVKYFASKLQLSSDYLSDLLHRYTGKTTLEHIHLQLVDKAKSLLRGTNKNISEIAFDLGFEHPSHFSKIFRNKVGASPKKFRNMD